MCKRGRSAKWDLCIRAADTKNLKKYDKNTTYLPEPNYNYMTDTSLTGRTVRDARQYVDPYVYYIQHLYRANINNSGYNPGDRIRQANETADKEVVQKNAPKSSFTDNGMNTTTHKKSVTDSTDAVRWYGPGFLGI